MNLLIDWALYSAALAIAAALVPGFKIKGGLKATLFVACLFGILNWFLAWLLTLLLGVVTLGLAWLFSVVTHTIVTAIVLKVTAGLTDKLTIKNFWSALLGAAFMSLSVAILRGIIQ
jgi:uncharacterized membrane protein YvlD (DUF360 family)